MSDSIIDLFSDYYGCKISQYQHWPAGGLTGVLTVRLTECLHSHVVDGAGNGDCGPVFSQDRDVCGPLSVSEWGDVVILSIMGNITADHRPHAVSKLRLNQSVRFLFTDVTVTCYRTNDYFTVLKTNLKKVKQHTNNKLVRK